MRKGDAVKLVVIQNGVTPPPDTETLWKTGLRGRVCEAVRDHLYVSDPVAVAWRGLTTGWRPEGGRRDNGWYVSAAELTEVRKKT